MRALVVQPAECFSRDCITAEICAVREVASDVSSASFNQPLHKLFIQCTTSEAVVVNLANLIQPPVSEFGELAMWQVDGANMEHLLIQPKEVAASDIPDVPRFPGDLGAIFLLRRTSGLVHSPSTRPAAPRPARGEPPLCSKTSASGPPSAKALAHCPIVWASRSNAWATAAAVHPWASSHTACHLSRSRGVGAPYIRRHTSASSMRHRSSSGPISFMPNCAPTPSARRIT